MTKPKKPGISAEQLEERRELAALCAIEAQIEADKITPGSELGPEDTFDSINAKLKQRGLPPFANVTEFQRAVSWYLDNLEVEARIEREDATKH
jgi:hypothetical protein